MVERVEVWVVVEVGGLKSCRVGRYMVIGGIGGGGGGGGGGDGDGDGDGGGGGRVGGWWKNGEWEGAEPR
jgi:hypothetical protein